MIRQAGLYLACVSVLAMPLGASNVRPLSDAERAAVESAAVYLSGGPDALVRRLSPTSALQKVGGAEAAKEIEARLGPPDGATWELQTVVPALADRMAVFNIDFPSGVDETATLELNKAGQIENIRILADESARKPAFGGAVADRQTKAKSSASDGVAFALGIVAALFSSAAAFARRAKPSVANFAIIVAALSGIGGLTAALAASDHARVGRNEPQAAAVTASATETFPRLAPLLGVRRAIATGTGLANVPGATSPVARLWKAQVDLQQMRIDDVKTTLATFPSPSTIPLVEILRGRVALFEQDEAASAIAYEHAVSLGPGRDGLWSETAHALLALGYEDRSLRYLERLDRIGARDANTYFALAMFRAARKNEDEAEKFFATGWALRPARRADVISAGVLWSVIRKPMTATLVSLSDPDERSLAPSMVSTRAITLPEGATARTSGDYLSVHIGDRELRVPGGACLAPPGTPVVDAATWATLENEKALQDYPRLVSVARTAGAYTQPTLRRRITESALALAERNRWPDLLRLTDGLSPRSEHVPPLLFFIRARALERMQRPSDAKELLAQLASGHVLQRRRDARALEQLGEMLASLELYDAAVRMLDRATAIKQSERIEFTVAQIQMNKRLATKYSTYNSAHFEIHYPEDVSGVSARLIGDILEAELRRMQAWVPTPDFKPVVVNIVWWREFKSVLTGNEFTLGTYQGKITVPLAGVPIYPPEIVALLTHELCHAMIAQATNEQAPRWFQEGMAQRMEMVGLMRNAFNMYDDSKLLALSLLDSVMADSPDPEMIAEGYLLSEAAIRYIESKYGEAGLQKLIEQFRSGATTEEAIQALSGTTLAAFDRDFRQWGRAEPRIFETPITARYDSEEEPGISTPKKKLGGGFVQEQKQ